MTYNSLWAKKWFLQLLKGGLKKVKNNATSGCNMWSARCKIFTIWPFTEKVCQPVKTILHRNEN